MAGKTGHIAALVVGVGILIALAFGIELVNQEQEVFFLQLLPIQQWRLSDTDHRLFRLLPHLFKLPPLIGYILFFVVEGGAVIIGQIAIIVDFDSVLLGGVDHILEEERFFGSGVLVD